MRKQISEDRLKTLLYEFIAVVCLLLSVFCPSAVFAERIKDIASFEGVRENQIVGFGLVVGLDGAGDKSTATMQTIANLYQRMGMTVKANDIKAKNTAAVMVIATLPPFPKPGLKLDALVSTIADAKSLQGGALLLTPLKGPDGKVYAIAQGPVSIGGFVGGGSGTTIQKNHPTSGKIPNGVTIEAEPPFQIGSNGEMRLFLHRPDLTTVALAVRRINETLAGAYAAAVDPSTLTLKMPPEYAAKPIELMAIVEGVEVSVDVAARVVINERTGTIVIGDGVRISPVAIAHGSLTIEVKTDFQVSQPPPLAPEQAQTVVVPQQQVTVKEPKASLIEVTGVTLGEIVRALNALGVTPRDLIAILQALKASGSLRAQLEII